MSAAAIAAAPPHAMNDPFGHLGDLERRLGSLAVQITQSQLLHFTVANGWKPNVNAFRCGEQFIVCAELAGVDKDSIDLRAEPRRLTLSGVRPLPEPSCDDPPALQLLALEIDHGRFERVIELPAEIDPARVRAEHRNGLLWVKLPLRTHG